MPHAVRQNLLLPVTSSQILARLWCLDGLILLQDDGFPVIGCLPKWRISPHTSNVTVFQRRQSHGAMITQYIDGDFSAVLRQLWQPSASYSSESNLGFTGGLMGIMGYDWTAQHQLNDPLKSDPHTVNTYLGEYDIFFKEQENGWQLYGPDDADLLPIYDQLTALLHTQTPPPHLTWQLDHAFVPRWTYAQYQQAFDQLIEYIKAGDCYQVNLTQAFDSRGNGQLCAAWDRLIFMSRAPFAGYLKLDDQHEILSCSPELFLSFEDQRRVVTRPIKGTQPRYLDALRDEAAKQQLAQSQKDQSENLMIVDLLRNDLSRYAVQGSVKAPHLFEVQSFAQVHHLVSEIEAIRRNEVSSLDVLLNALPGGSITGAPKIRAMQIINELEAGSRGAYCGSMGYLNYNDTGRWNILIRTVQRHHDQVSVWAGGGITIASDCASEYQECLDKVGAILHTFNEFVCPTMEADVSID